MAGLVEAAVDRAWVERQSPAVGKGSLKRDSDDLTQTENVRSGKKMRFIPSGPMGPTITEAQNLPPTGLIKEKRRSKRTHIHAYPDAVAEGYVTETEGRELLKM